MTAYQNVWTQGDYIYHTVTSGITVYSGTGEYLGFKPTPDNVVVGGVVSFLAYDQNFNDPSSGNDWDPVAGPGYNFDNGFMENANDSTTFSDSVTFQTFESRDDYFDVSLRLMQGSESGSKTDTFMYFFKRPANPNTGPYFYIRLSAYGYGDTWDLFRFRLLDENDLELYDLTLRKWDYSANTGQWFWGRVKRDGDDFYFKHWGPDTGEPSEWDAVQTISGVGDFSGPLYAHCRTLNSCGYDDITVITTQSGVVDTVNYTSSVWANDEHVYLGTTNRGIYRALSSGILNNEFSIYKQEPYITDNSIVYLHGRGDYLCATTESGVDRFDLDGGSWIYTQNDNVNKCHQTASGDLYYIENTPFADVDEDDLGGPIREWNYYQILTFSGTPMDNAQVWVSFDSNFPFHNLKEYGEDIRFIDPDGNVLPYYIYNWFPAAEVLVKVFTEGTTFMYMLYGNRYASDQSNLEDVYWFYDNFSTLDESVWTVLKGHSNNYAQIVDNSYLRLYDYNNSGTAVNTTAKIPYSMRIEARVRSENSNSTDQFDFLVGYRTSQSKDRPNSGYVEIDFQTDADDKKHYLNSIDTAVQGTQSMSNTWYTWTGIWAPGYQYSNYRDETLETASTDPIFEGENYFIFHIDNSSIHRHLNVDWVRFSTWPDNYTYTNTQLNLWPELKPQLHAVYNPTTNWTEPDHTYDEFYGNPMLLNDIYTTPATSTTSGNTIFLATDRGVLVIDERQGDEENADIKRYYIK